MEIKYEKSGSHRGRGGPPPKWGGFGKEQLLCNKYLSFSGRFGAFIVCTAEQDAGSTQEQLDPNHPSFQNICSEMRACCCSGGCWWLLKHGAQRALWEGSRAVKRESLLFLQGRLAVVQLGSHRRQREFDFNGAELG